MKQVIKVSYRTQAENIQKRLSFFTRESVLAFVLKHLHSSVNEGVEEARKMPWVCFLAIEWHQQIQLKKNPKPAGDKEVYNLLNKIYLLQSDAVKLDGDLAIELGMRKLFLGQMRCQRAHMFHLFTLSRLFTLMKVNDVNSPFKRIFLNATGVELQDFYIFSLWMLSAFQGNRQKISYENILLHFHPKWSLEKLNKLIKLVATTPGNLSKVIENRNVLSPEQYFSKPQLIKSPLLLLPKSIQAIHSSLVTEGISEFTLNTMKEADHQRFRDKFTTSFEKYIEVILIENNANFTTETEINALYKKENIEGKVVDFIYENENAVVYIDAKGVEPHQRILITDNQNIIKDRLKDNYLKGLEQACECSRLLDEHTQIIDKTKNKYALVITHQDFYLGFGKRLEKTIGEENTQKIIEKCGTEISFDNVHFCSVEDFESIMALCKETNLGLDEFLDYCSLQQTQPDTQKFSMRQHINDFTIEKSEFVKSPIGTNLIVDEQKAQFDILKNIIKENQQYWQANGAKGVSISNFINVYLKFKRMLFAN